MEKTKGRKRWKRFTAAALAMLMAMGGVDLSGFAVNAKTSEEAGAEKTQLLITEDEDAELPMLYVLIGSTAS